MNKTDLVAEIAKATNLTKTDSEKALKAVTDSITTALTNGAEVRLVGFGTFKVSERKAGEGRNPRTGDVIKIPASNLPKFRPGKALKDAVNSK